jgi:hypothetical protein
MQVTKDLGEVAMKGEPNSDRGQSLEFSRK